MFARGIMSSFFGEPIRAQGQSVVRQYTLPCMLMGRWRECGSLEPAWKSEATAYILCTRFVADGQDHWGTTTPVANGYNRAPRRYHGQRPSRLSGWFPRHLKIRDPICETRGQQESTWFFLTHGRLVHYGAWWYAIGQEIVDTA